MPLTPERAYPYPTSTDHDRIWEHFESLADAVDTDVDALLSPVETSGASVFTAASGYVRFSAVARTLLGGKLVYLTLGITATSGITSSAGNMSDTTFGTIANANLRPTEVTNSIFSANPGTGEVILNDDGTVVGRTLDVNVNAAGLMRMCFSFIRA